jgi:hypothetical protein
MHRVDGGAPAGATVAPSPKGVAVRSIVADGTHKYCCTSHPCPHLLQLLIGKIEDEKRMFAGEHLTRVEREQMAFNEKVLRLATEIKSSFDAKADDVYKMPQSYERDEKGFTERQKLLKARFQCAPSSAPSQGCDIKCQPIGNLELHNVFFFAIRAFVIS